MSERDMRRLLELVARHLHLGWTDINDWLRDQNAVEEIEERLRRGEFANAIVGVDDAAQHFAAIVQRGYVESGDHAAQWLDAKIDDALVRFDTNAPSIVLRARTNELEYVQGFREEQYALAQQITQRAITEGAGLGANPRAVARQFRDAIGLTTEQEQYVANYRRALETGDYANAMGRQLHDDRSNRKLIRARDKGITLDQDYVDKLTENYRQAQIDWRAENIARTEGMANTEDGVSDAIGQAVQRGDVDADQLTKTWHAGPRTRWAREDHQAMDEVTVKYGEDFVLPDGTRMSRPHDRRGGAKHNAGCRCTSSTTLL